LIHDVAESYTAAWCSHDPARVAAHHTPDSSLTINDGEPAVGTAAITEAARDFMVALPDLDLVMDDLVVREDGVEYHWTCSGTNTGPGGTGNRVRFSGYEEWTIGDDGLITKSLGHFDAAEYARQIEHGA
jgi:predicted ester cyclase